ncbi:hypothetical protein KC874_04565 [Candidatus Saccharibacteria bacterium]|nr:hypothetical protein [Candidatus Saccharibacteria bacterium]
MENIPKEHQDESERFRITQLLKKHEVDIFSWGSYEAKTVEHLISEVLSGESQLLETDQGELLRVLEVADGTITYTDSLGAVYKLTEDRQEFADGRVRKREHLKDISLAEKVAPGEDPKQALLRGIDEELGITGDIYIVGNPTLDEKQVESPSFPGLKTQYRVHKYKLVIGSDSFNPDGYKEQQSDKTTYFIWDYCYSKPDCY